MDSLNFKEGELYEHETHYAHKPFLKKVMMVVGVFEKSKEKVELAVFWLEPETLNYLGADELTIEKWESGKWERKELV